jgi:hypothetical protein
MLDKEMTAVQWELIDDSIKTGININKIYKQGDSFFAFSNFGIEISDNLTDWKPCFQLPPSGADFNPPILHGLYINGNSLFAPSDSSKLYYSYDNGVTWDTTTFDEDPKPPIQHMQFVNDTLGFLGSVKNSILMKTTDGGINWYPLPDASNQFGLFVAISSFVAVDENNIYIIRNNAKNEIIHTSDGGKSWKHTSNIEFKETDFANNGYKFFIYKKPYFYLEYKYKPGPMGNSSIQRSLDCINWEPVFIGDTIGGGKSLADIRIYDDIIMGIGRNIFIVSKDGGNSWNDLYDENDDFWKLRDNMSRSTLFYHNEYIYSIGGIHETGEDGLVYNRDRFYKYNLSLSSVEFQHELNFSVFPNPSNDFITIQFQPSEGFELSEGYRVQIFNVLGIEVMSVRTGLDLSTQKIDVSHLPAGVYFIRIGDKVEKFVKM